MPTAGPCSGSYLFSAADELRRGSRPTGEHAQRARQAALKLTVTIRGKTDPAAGEEDQAGWVPDALPHQILRPADAPPFAMPASQPLQAAGAAEARELEQGHPDQVGRV